MQTPSPPPTAYQERVIRLASRGFRLIKLALYQNRPQLALDIADSMQMLPLEAPSRQHDLLTRRVEYVAQKYDDENELHGFAESWLRWALTVRANA